MIEVSIGIENIPKKAIRLKEMLSRGILIAFDPATRISHRLDSSRWYISVSVVSLRAIASPEARIIRQWTDPARDSIDDPRTDIKIIV
jgi:hypothetical protein